MTERLVLPRWSWFCSSSEHMHTDNDGFHLGSRHDLNWLCFQVYICSLAMVAFSLVVNSARIDCWSRSLVGLEECIESVFVGASQSTQQFSICCLHAETLGKWGLCMHSSRVESWSLGSLPTIPTSFQARKAGSSSQC